MSSFKKNLDALKAKLEEISQNFKLEINDSEKNDIANRLFELLKKVNQQRDLIELKSKKIESKYCIHISKFLKFETKQKIEFCINV